MKKLLRLFKRRSTLLVLAAFAIYFLPRIVSLGWDMANYDARYWYPRMHRFTEAVLEGDWEHTYQKYHPGVTLMWTSGFSNHLLETVADKFLDRDIRHNALYFPYVHFVSKLPLVVLISVLGALCFYLIWKVTNLKFAFIFTFFLSLEPFFLGVSRFLHLSALTSMFMFASFLCMYVFLNRVFKIKDSPRKSYFLLSSIFLGLATLTKIDGGIIGVANAVLILMHTNLKKLGDSPSKKDYPQLPLRQAFLLIFGHAFISLATFFLLFPAMWLDPVRFVIKIIKEGLNDTAFSSSGADSFLHIKELYYLEAFVFRSLPTSVVFTYSFWVFFLKKKLRDAKIRNFIKASLVVFAVNLAFFIFPDKTKDRYLINFYPYFLILAAYTFYHLLGRATKNAKIGLMVMVALVYGITLYRYHPNYSFYYSDMLGGVGGLRGLGLSTVQRGEFYARAALFLNDYHPEAYNRNAIVLRREQHPSFKWFYLGNSYVNSKFMPKVENRANFIVSQVEYLDQIPSTCELIRTFGVRPPFKFDQLWVYDCGETVDNSYKFRN